jgi:hypothetical protein
MTLLKQVTQVHRLATALLVELHSAVIFQRSQAACAALLKVLQVDFDLNIAGKAAGTRGQGATTGKLAVTQLFTHVSLTR